MSVTGTSRWRRKAVSQLRMIKTSRMVAKARYGSVRSLKVKVRAAVNPRQITSSQRIMTRWRRCCVGAARVSGSLLAMEFHGMMLVCKGQIIAKAWERRPYLHCDILPQQSPRNRRRLPRAGVYFGALLCRLIHAPRFERHILNYGAYAASNPD